MPEVTRFESILDSGRTLSKGDTRWLISELKKRKKTAQTWQSKYSKLKTEFDELKKSVTGLGNNLIG